MRTLSATWPALGTTVNVVVTDPSGLHAACAAVAERIEAVDRTCSRFRADSDLTRLNDAAAGRPNAVSPALADAVAVALRAAAATGGAVDPTVGTALILAGYDETFTAVSARAERPPTVRSARVPGWRAVVLDPVSLTVTLPRGVRLDLGATAKAWCADRATAEAAQAAGPACGVLVSLGGDVAVAGPAPAGGWVVRVAEDHRAADDAPSQAITIRDGGLATSTTTVRRWATGSAGSAHHLIDPVTGRPAAGPWRTVTVAAASCVDANVASTAAVVRADGAAWLTARELPSRLVAQDGQISTVAGWPEAQPAGVAA